MKRFIVVLLVIQVLFLPACSVPFFGGKSSGSPSDEEQKMVQLPDSTRQSDVRNDSGGSAAAGDTQAGAGNKPAGTGGAYGGMTGDTSGGTQAGAADGTAGTANAGSGGTPRDGTDVAGVTTGTEPGAEAGMSDSQNTGGSLYQGAMGPSPVNVSGAAKANGEDRLAVTVFYQDKEGFLIPVTRWIQLQQGIARAALSLTIDSAVNREELAYYGVYPVLPEGTGILGIDIRDGVATVDFDRHVLNYGSAAAERNIVASIVYTLTGFKTVERVRILINGYEQGVLKFGTDISGTAGREDIAVNADVSAKEDGAYKADIFLFRQANEQFTYLVPVSIADGESAGDLPGSLVRRLLSENAEGGLYNEMPSGAELLEWNMNEGVLTLNFSKSFTAYGGNSKEEAILKQLAYTAGQIENIKGLRIMIEGAAAQLPEGTDISDGLSIPVTINDVMGG